MSQLLEAFVLGNGAILGNICMLPLYPGLIAFLASNASNERTQRAMGWMGLLILAGVLSLMTLVGFGLFLFQRSFSAILPAMLPLIYGGVLILGLLLLAGKNPFARLAVAAAPIGRNPYATAYLYGLLLGPMTLPCTGPLIVSAFVLGASSGAALADGLLYFLAFGLGFGWPLVFLPLLALPAQRRFTQWITSQHQLLTSLSGVLLVGISLFGFWSEVRPNW